MSCEPIGIITVRQYIQGCLAPDARAFIETARGLREVYSVDRRDNAYYAELRNPPDRSPQPTHYRRVYLNASVYVAYEDLSVLDPGEVKTGARRAVFGVRLPFREVAMPCEGVPLGSYWNS